MDKPETLLTVRDEPCWMVTGPLSVSIQRRSDGTLWIVGRKKMIFGDRACLTSADPTGTTPQSLEEQLLDMERTSTVRTRRPFTSRQLNAIMKRLGRLRILAFPAPRVGCDGGYTELEVGGYEGKAHYRWWSMPPKGWERLNELARDIIQMSGLPARIKNTATPRRKHEKKWQSLAQLLTNGMLSRLAGETIFERGVAYRHDGMVNGLTVTGDAIAATVMGGRNYQAKFWRAANNTLAYSCTCPFFAGGSGLCKHLVALGLEWLGQAPSGKTATPEPRS